MSNISDNTNKFLIQMKVRDYECDMQGIVNNAVYLNYLEHARHEYLDSMGMSFKRLTQEGIYVVAMKSEQLYKKSLTSGEEFKVTCVLTQESKFKIRFTQEILNANNEIVLQASLIAGVIDQDKKPLLVEKTLHLKQL